jgi:hypothetical protein
MFDEFVTAAQRRARAYQQQISEEEETQEAEQLGFSIRRIVDERGSNSEVYSILSAGHRRISRQLGYFDCPPWSTVELRLYNPDAFEPRVIE